MPADKPKSGETKEDYLSYCIAAEIAAGYPQDQAAAICYSKWREEKMKKSNQRVAAKIQTINKFKGINLNFAGEVNMEDPCWSGYRQYGTKIVDGREVPDCRGPIEGVD
jgi:hypothetical protein